MISMTMCLSDEIGALVFNLRSRRLTLREQAIHYNLMRFTPPALTLESRLDSLAVELRHLKENLT